MQARNIQLPSRLGHFLLVDRLSTGGMAEVFLAKLKNAAGDDLLVALKLILPAIAEDEEFASMFADEAKIASQLTHANIVRVVEFGAVDDNHYIAFEYIQGADLRSLLADLRDASEVMPIAQACYLVAQLCEGLDYVHNKADRFGRPMHLIHRDVSPHNVLVSYEGDVKLIDFGIAKALGRRVNTQSGVLRGKFGYMSPEQVRGLPLDKRTDVFSLGCVLYELLTGCRVFQADSEFSTLEKIRDADFVPPSSKNPAIPEALEQIVLRALRKDVDDRYEDTASLSEALQKYLFETGQFSGRANLRAWIGERWTEEIVRQRERLESLRSLTADSDRCAERIESVPREDSEAETSTPRGHADAEPDPPGGSEEQVEPPGSAGSGAMAGRSDAVSPGKAGSGPIPLPDDLLESCDSLPSSATPSGLSQRSTLPAPATTPHGPAEETGSAQEMVWADEEIDTQIYKDMESRTPMRGPRAEAFRDEAVKKTPLSVPTAQDSDSGSLDIEFSQSGSTSALAVEPAEPPSLVAQVVSAEAGGDDREMDLGGRSRAVFATAVLILVCCALALYYFISRGREPGSLKLEVVPKGAALFIDGRRQEELAVPTIEPGFYIVRLEHEAYENWEDTVEIRPGRAQTLRVALKARASASIELRSNPEGAAVLLDGRRLDGVTPLEVSRVVAGRHRLELEHEEQQLFRREEFEIKAGQRIQLLLRLVPKKLSLRVLSTPAGEVFLIVDGEPRSLGVAPTETEVDPQHELRVRVVKQGYASWEQAIEYEGEPTIKVVARLKRLLGAQAAKEAKRRGRSKPTGGTRRQAKVSGALALKTAKSPVPAKGATKRRKARRAGKGTLRINSRPWTQIAIDGQDTGLVTPQVGIDVSAGTHQVTLSNPKFQIQETFTVVVRPGQSTKLVKNFSQAAAAP